MFSDDYGLRVAGWMRWRMEDGGRDEMEEGGYGCASSGSPEVSFLQILNKQMQ